MPKSVPSTKCLLSLYPFIAAFSPNPYQNLSTQRNLSLFAVILLRFNASVNVMPEASMAVGSSPDNNRVLISGS